jgi:hypothetical protein
VDNPALLHACFLAQIGKGAYSHRLRSSMHLPTSCKTSQELPNLLQDTPSHFSFEQPSQSHSVVDYES